MKSLQRSTTGSSHSSMCRCRDQQVSSASVSFRVNAHEGKKHGRSVLLSDHPGISEPQAYHVIIDFEEHNPISEYEKPLKRELIVKHCVFYLGTDYETAFPTRVTGIFFEKGQIENQQ